VLQKSYKKWLRCLFGKIPAPIFSVVIILIFFAVSFAELLPVKTYTVADGLLRDNVAKIRRDSRGFLWFCTAEGVSRFDGVAMTNFTVADGLPERNAEDFLETRSGTIYIATDQGLARLNPHGIRASTENPLFTVFLPDDPKAQKILTLYEDNNRQVWVGTADGLYKLIETGGQVAFEFVPLGEPLGGVEADAQTLFINTILEDRFGTLWIGTLGSGLFRRDSNGEVRRLTISDGLGDNRITDLLEDRENRLWASFRNGQFGGLCLLDAEASENSVKKCYSTKDGLPNNWIPDLLETSDGKFWLATVSGLCEWQGENSASVCKTYTAKNGLCYNATGLVEDKDGNLWVGSSCGAQKIARYGFTTYGETDGLGSRNVNSIFENEAGELFISINENRRDVSRFDGDKFSLVKPLLLPSSYYGWGWQQTVLQDSRGAWWIPTGAGVVRSPDNTSFENLANSQLETVKIGAKLSEVFRVFEDSRGDIWISVWGNELLRFERARNIWHDYTPQVGFSKYRVGSAFVEDRNGNVWIGASSDHGESALIRYRSGEFRVMSEAEGAPSGWIRDLFLDSRGRLWIASTNSGLWRLDDPNSDVFAFTKYTPANGLTSISTASVTEDEFGRIYVGTWRGVDRLNPDTGQVENFTTADGLPASFVEVSYRDRRNNLWFGTHEGVARFVPEPPRVRQPPTILITGLRVEGEPQSVSVLGETAIPQLDLSSAQRQISLDFLGLGASLGEKLKYEYRFSDADWTPTTERTINFANLASGDYKFEVRAQTADRIYSQPAIVSFRIAAPVWQRWWFIVSAAILISLIIYSIYRNRLKRLLEMERMRTRIATDLHDDIGANLTRISLLSEVAKQNAVNGNGNLLTSIAGIARESVASMNDIVWAIAPEHDSLLDLTRRMRQHAEEVFALREIDLSFDAPAADTDLKLSVGVRRDVLLIFKEAVNNAARHSDCSRVAINFSVENAKLLLQIKDNGVGFAADSESDGQGLRSMARRAKALGGVLTIESNNGTLVKFELILAKNSRI
jgi:ligand-binding sensor domain-containing protein/two-component sensor histidine kinase